MLTFLIKRCAQMIVTLVLISLLGFVIIQLPPGDYLTTLEAEMIATGGGSSRVYVDAMRESFGLDQPLYVQYALWVKGFAQGNFGFSFEHSRPVLELVVEPFALSMLIAFATMLFTLLVGIPIGIYSAKHQYSLGDYLATVFGFFGLATPNFLLALSIPVLAIYVFNSGYTGGLFSPEYRFQPWSFEKILDLMRYIWVPVLVLGTGGIAEIIRVMRASLLDELTQNYVATARSKGLSERVVTNKHALRVAINPIISLAGMQLPRFISGEVVTAIVLSLPTAGPLFYHALRAQDMYLAGTILMLMALLLVIGNLVADLALAWSDPRIRLG